MRWGPAEKITVDINPERVTFRDSETPPVEWPPIVYVAVGTRRPKVLSAGAPPTDGTPALPVDLLASEPPPHGVSKLDCLAAFFAAGLKILVDRYLFRVRPEVTVHGAERISARFSGYERDLLTQALQRAGAKRINWLPDAPSE